VVGFGKYNDEERPWVIGFPQDVYTRLLQEGNERFGEGNNPDPYDDDMKAFYHLTGVSQPISRARKTILVNLEKIKTLIEVYKLVPLPVKPKLRYEYFYGIRYDFGRQLQAITHAIYLCPTLIECWKNIGYMHINYDTNEYVIRTAMLILYPCPPGSNLL